MPSVTKTLRRKRMYGGIRSRRSRSPRPQASPQALQLDSDTVPLDVSDYQHALIHEFIHVDHDSTSPSGDSYVSYQVDEKLRPLLHDYFVFQTPADFDFEWLKQSKAYVRDLSVFDKYVLRAYTRHGDELVNAYLRNPAGFQTEPRVLELLFEIMPSNYNLPFASILAQDYISANMNRSYVEDDFFDITGDVRELGHRVQHVFIDQVLRVQPIQWPRILDLMDRYIQTFRDILQNAPRPSEPLLVFRGVQTDYMNRVKEAVPFSGFTSTTYSVDIAATFAKANRRVYEILILPGTPCVCLDGVSEFEGTECEILVDTGIFAMAEKKFEKKRLHPALGYAEPLQAATVLEAKGPTFQSRLVVMHPQQDQLGGRVSKQKKWKSSQTTRRTLRTRKFSKKSRKSRAPSMYARAEPTPQWGAPVPAMVQQRLRDAVAAFRSKRA